MTMNTPLPPDVRKNVPLATKTTYKIGGDARYYCRTADPSVIATSVTWAHEADVPLFVLGKGSNILVSDEGWPGLVLHLDSETGKSVSWSDNAVTVYGMTALNRLVKSVVDNGYSGIEELAGIPGTVGGAVVMNAGAFTQSISDTLLEVTCCDLQTGEVHTRSASELQLGYRTSILKVTREIVLSARFQFTEKTDKNTLEEKRCSILEKRKMKQPLDFPNCGSVFKRPPGNYAGTLIENAGLKGMRYGGARISEKHGNFIINTGNAKADDVRYLIVHIQKNVYEQFGILLEPEVIFIGSFRQPLFTPQHEELQ